MSLKTEQALMQKKFRLLLNRVYTKHHLYDKELGLMMGVDNPQVVNMMRNGRATIQECRMVTLCKNLISEYDDSFLLDYLIPEDHMAIVMKLTNDQVAMADSLNQIIKFVAKITEESEKPSDEIDFEAIQEMSKEIAKQTTNIYHTVKS
jgi:hypothetical protein